MMNINNLKKILSSSQSNQWLYTEKTHLGSYEIKVTHGYVDKVLLCILDLFFNKLRGSRHAQEVIVSILQKEVSQIETHNGALDKPFKTLEKVENYQNVISYLNQCKFVWGSQFSLSPPELDAEKFCSLETHIAKVKDIYSVLPSTDSLLGIEDIEEAFLQFKRSKSEKKIK